MLKGFGAKYAPLAAKYHQITQKRAKITPSKDIMRNFCARYNWEPLMSPGTSPSLRGFSIHELGA